MQSQWPSSVLISPHFGKIQTRKTTWSYFIIFSVSVQVILLSLLFHRRVVDREKKPPKRRQGCANQLCHTALPEPHLSFQAFYLLWHGKVHLCFLEVCGSVGASLKNCSNGQKWAIGEVHTRLGFHLQTFQQRETNYYKSLQISLHSLNSIAPSQTHKVFDKGCDPLTSIRFIASRNKLLQQLRSLTCQTTGTTLTLSSRKVTTSTPTFWGKRSNRSKSQWRYLLNSQRCGTGKVAFPSLLPGALEVAFPQPLCSL